MKKLMNKKEEAEKANLEVSLKCPWLLFVFCFFSIYMVFLISSDILKLSYFHNIYLSLKYFS